MPFSKYIEHEQIEAMRAAFYKVCDALLLNGEVDDPMTEVVVNKIMAKAGEHDADRLAEHVLNDLIERCCVQRPTADVVQSFNQPRRGNFSEDAGLCRICRHIMPPSQV